METFFREEKIARLSDYRGGLRVENTP
jgi:hypothetical protein